MLSFYQYGRCVEIMDFKMSILIIGAVQEIF